MVMREMNMEIINTDRWDLERLTVRTFARCVAKKNWDEDFFNALSSVGLTYMRDISHWFRQNHQFEDHPICEIVKVLIDKEEYKIWQGGEVNLKIPAKIFKTRKIGPTRAEMIAELVQDGIKNIINDPRREMYIPRQVRLTESWQLNSVAQLSKGQYSEVVSDGSKLLVGGFAVVNGNGDLVVSSAITGKQRA